MRANDTEPTAEVPDPEVDLEGHMTEVKWPATREVVNLLRDEGIRALHIGNPALDDMRSEEIRYYDDLDLLIQESDLGAFMQTMEAGGYRRILDDPHKGDASEPTTEQATRISMGPTRPDMSYARELKWPADLWVSWRSTWRHNILMLVDLGDWFERTETLTTAGGAEIERPPSWAMVACYAATLTGRAQVLDVDRSLVDDVHLATGLPGLDWAVLVERLQAYEQEQVQRLPRVLDVMRAAWERDGIPTTMTSSNTPREFFGKRGALYEVRHGLEAVEAYYPGSVPDTVLTALRAGSGQYDRRVGVCRDLTYSARYYLEAPGGHWQTKEGIAPFGIREQIEQYGHMTPEEMFAGGVVEDLGTNPEAPPFGMWYGFTEAQLADLFAPLS